MRKFIILIFTVFFLYACEEEKGVIDELNITLNSAPKSSFGIEPLNYTKVEIYPNPFHNILNIGYSGADNCEIYIYNYEGSGKKFITEEQHIQIDFSNEKDGAYIIELLINGVVYREIVIKEK